MLACERCGREAAPDAHFCAGCGAALADEQQPLREERKVVTVLFADLVGFTSKAERLDPEDVRAMLSPYYARLRHELERHGGTVEKFIGDAVMAVFGAPVAHEDDPERAVRAALAIRDATGDELQVRIGVNTGEALVALGARPSEGEAMVAGDVVNTAARLQAAAPLNGILVGEQTYRATQRTIAYRDAESVAAKGKAEPMTVWEVLEARSRFGVDVVQRAPAPLVGRRREVDLLVDAFSRVRAERSPQLVTLVGAPGLGKSRLVYELFRAVDEDEELIFWRQGRSLPYGEGVTFWALGEMVKSQAGILETDDAEAAAAKLRAAVDAVVEDAGDARWVETHLRALAGLGGDSDVAADRREEAFTAWRRFFEAMAEHSPLVLVFEDLHWADDGLLDFVDHLVDWAYGVPILVVASARPELIERRPGWGGGKRNATTLSLPPLSDDDTARLVAALLDRAVLPADTQLALLARAEGNPLYAEEYARMLAAGAAPGDGIPETLQGIIAARLDALPPEEKALVQDASVLGKVFWLGALEAFADEPAGVLERRLHALERKEFVRRERASSVEGDAQYAFLHVLMRDVAYAQIPRAARADKHLAAAEWIERLGRAEDAAEMLAHHFLSALEYRRAAGLDVAAIAERVAGALAAAGDRALALNAFEAAERFYAAALELESLGTKRRRRVLLQRARNLHRWHSIERFPDLLPLRDELKAAGDLAGAAEVSALLSWSSWMLSDRVGAHDFIAEALELLAGQPPSRAQSVVLAERARLLALGGRPHEAVEDGRRALAIAEELGLAELRPLILNTMGLARKNAGDPAGVEDIERSVALAREAHSPLDVVRGYGNLASLTMDTGELARSYEYHRLALAEAERFGIGAGVRWQRGERPWHEYHFGRWDDALASCERYFAEGDGSGPHFMEPAVRSVRALMRLARGDAGGASEDVERALGAARELDPQSLHPVLGISALVAAATGRAAEATVRTDELLDVWRQSPDAIYFNPADLAFAAVLVGRWRAFLDLGETVPVASRWLMAAIAFARGDHAAAAGLFADIGSQPSVAYASLAAAESLVASGRRAEADEHLRAALAFYRSVGATFFVRRGEALLAASA